ncbi:MAG: hypothetical protein E7298_14610 [Lachnospiraceae bacterium]|nr:hypothetical protein [Lachnospiraceae bacterium]
MKYTAVPLDYLEEMAELTDAEFGRLIRGLMRYCRDGEAIEAQGNERFFAKRVMNQQDNYTERYRTLSEKRSEAGKKGAAVTNQRRRDAAAAEEESRQTAKHNSTEHNSTEQYSTEQSSTEQSKTEQTIPVVQNGRTEEQTLTREETELYRKYKAKGMTPTQARVEAAVRRLGMHSNWNDEEECT